MWVRTWLRSYAGGRLHNLSHSRHHELLLTGIPFEDGHAHPAQLAIDRRPVRKRDHEIHDYARGHDRERAGRASERFPGARAELAARAAADAASRAPHSVPESDPYGSHAFRVSTVDG